MMLSQHKRVNRRVEPRRRAAVTPRPPRRLPGRRTRVVALGLLLAALAAWQLPGYLPRNLFPIRQIRVHGPFRHVTLGQVRARVAPFAGQGFFSVSLSGVARAVEALPWVRKAVVRRVWPEGLEVRVWEQRAVARWGDSGLVNGRGTVFATDAAAGKSLPRLDGPRGSAAGVLDAYRQARKVLAAAGLRLVALQENRRGGWRARLAQGTGIRIGRGDPATALQNFVAAGLASVRADLPHIAYIDLRYPNGFAVADRTTGSDGQGAGKG